MKSLNLTFNYDVQTLEKKEKVLLKKVTVEVERAKEFTRAKNKRAAIQCLKRKSLYEQQVEQLGNFQLCIHDQMILLEGAKSTTETVDALRTGAAAMKALQKDELEGAELEEQLLQPATTAPSAPIHLPTGRQQVRPAA
ncbi:hypothetical protein K7X08_004025 [Anisodus acutangulus]|uniref:Uncharacterized protein n=1 Tax=Anisodus acutangulus TaxID=402998 RepID=A0A9Q1MLT4_9SOLA|nr:hypothetical protein K7X08_004025 [Anisodus acutangulus]